MTTGELATAWAQLHRDRPAWSDRPRASNQSLVGMAPARGPPPRGESAAARRPPGISIVWPSFSREDSSIAVRLAAAYETADDWNNVARAASLAIAAGSRDVETVVRRGWAQIYLGTAGRGSRRLPPGPRARTRFGGVSARPVPGTGRAGDLALANAHWRQVIDDLDEPRTDRWNTIATHLSRLTKSRPESWWFWRARGHVSMRLGHPDEAEAYYGKAIAAQSE